MSPQQASPGEERVRKSPVRPVHFQLRAHTLTGAPGAPGTRTFPHQTAKHTLYDKMCNPTSRLRLPALSGRGSKFAQHLEKGPYKFRYRVSARLGGKRRGRRKLATARAGWEEKAGPVWRHALLVMLKAAITGELKRVISPFLAVVGASEDPHNEPILRQELFGDSAVSSLGTVRYTTNGTQRHPGPPNLLQPRSSAPMKMLAPGCRLSKSHLVTGKDTLFLFAFRNTPDPSSP